MSAGFGATEPNPRPTEEHDVHITALDRIEEVVVVSERGAKETIREVGRKVETKGEGSTWSLIQKRPRR